MEETKMVAILSALANGVNPTTGEIFGRDSPYQHADIVRALFAALERFKQQDGGTEARVNVRRAYRTSASRGATKRTAVAHRVRSRPPPNELARDLGRTLAGIEARLERQDV